MKSVQRTPEILNPCFPEKASIVAMIQMSNDLHASHTHVVDQARKDEPVHERLVVPVVNGEGRWRLSRNTGSVSNHTFTVRHSGIVANFASFVKKPSMNIMMGVFARSFRTGSLLVMSTNFLPIDDLPVGLQAFLAGTIVFVVRTRIRHCKSVLWVSCIQCNLDSRNLLTFQNVRWDEHSVTREKLM